MPTAFLKPALQLFVFSLPFWILFRILSNRIKKIAFRKEVLLFLFFSYLVCLVAVTLLPVPFARYNNLHTRGINLIPVHNTWQEVSAVLSVKNKTMFLRAMENILGNILLFIPLGFLLPLIMHWYRKFPRTLLMGLLCSALIEVSQGISRILGIYRFADIDDVILNTIGTAIGFWIARACITYRDIPGVSKNDGTFADDTVK